MSNAWLDLSHHNVVDNWVKVAAKYSGVKLKATEGNNFIDPKFYEYYDEATKRGLKVNAYHFARFANEADARLEADFHVKVLGDRKVYNDESVLDIETNDNKLDPHVLTSCMLEFSKELSKKRNLNTVVYSYPSFIKNELESFNLPLWLADYSSDGKYYNDLKDLYNIVMIQYTSKGHVDGIQGHVDMDRAVQGKVVEIHKPTPKVNSVEYKVKKGDTLWNLAQRFNTTVQDLVALNGIKNPDLIRTGDVLKVHGKARGNEKEYYVVKSGDNLSSIAAAHQTQLQIIEKLNPQIKDPDKIYPGEKVRVK